MRWKTLLPTALLFLAAACGDSAPADPDGGPADGAAADSAGHSPDASTARDGSNPAEDAGPNRDAGSRDATPTDGDVTLPWFDEDHVLQVSIQMDAVAWQSLREQGRDFQQLFSEPTCLDQPFDSPFTYFPGTVTVDGITASNVGVRKKGFLGSLSSTKPSLKIKMQEYDTNKLLAGEKRMTLNNSVQDPSFARTCLSFRVFRTLGLPAPRCNFARVSVNGEDLGLYVHVEEVKKPFLRQHFANADGPLFEGTLADFRDGFLDAFENKADVPLPSDRAALEALTAAAARPLNELEAALAPLLDVDSFIRQWAADALIGHWDGYAGNVNNFFAYQDPTDGRFHIMPWGPDTAFSRSPFNPVGSPSSVYANGVLAHRLYQLPAVRGRYLVELRRILDLVTEESLHDALDAHETQLGAIVADPSSFSAELGAIHGFVTVQRAAIESELATSGVDWPLPLRGTPCFHTTGPLNIDLRSTFGTHPADDPFLTGTGTLSVSLNGVSFPSGSIGSAVGLGVDADDLGEVVLAAQIVYPSGFSLFAYVVIDPQLVFPGAVIPIDDIGARGILFRAVSPVLDYQVQGFLRGGTVEIVEGSAADGVPFRAIISADIEERFRL